MIMSLMQALHRDHCRDCPKLGQPISNTSTILHKLGKEGTHLKEAMRVYIRRWKPGKCTKASC